MSRLVEREYVEDDRDVVVEDRSFFASPLAIALAVVAVVVLLFLVLAGISGSDDGGGTNQPTQNAPARDAGDTGTGAGGDQTGGGSDAEGGGGANTGNGGNTNSGADGGAGQTP